MHGKIRRSTKPYRQRVVDFQPIEGEKWKDCVGYEGIYRVSSLGRVSSYVRTVPHNNRKTGIQQVGGTLFSLQDHELGYKIVQLFKDGKSKTCKVHALVALAFIPNPHNKKTVNHINGIRDDNRVENLEWATHSENNADRFKRQNALIQSYKHAYDLTVGAGINPEAVSDLLESLKETLAQFKKIDKHYSKDHEIMARAEAAIEKAQIK